MKKTFGKLFACFMAAVAAFSVAGCKGGKISEVDDGEGVLNILCMEAGYGTTFMDEWIKEFKKVPGNEDVTVNPVYDVQVGDTTLSLLNDPSLNPYDLILTGTFSYVKHAENGLLEDLSGVVSELDYPLLDSYADFGKYKGKTYVLPWVHGPAGIIYNTDMLPAERIPKTTDELVALCGDITAGRIETAKDIKPFVWGGSNAGNYWRYSADCWWAQYDGVDAYRDFWTFTVDGIPNSPDGYRVYGQQGILESYTVLENILKPDYCVYGSQSKDHTTSQSDFMLGRAVMIPCGDWMESEMRKNYASVTNYKLMRTPVISALGDKLKLAGDGATHSQNDEKLSEVVGYIDDGKTDGEISALTGVTVAKAAAVREARLTIYSMDSRHQVFIPSSSNAKDEAKAFIKFMSSLKASEIFQKEARSQQPYDYGADAVVCEGASSYLKNNIELVKDAKFIFPDYDTSSIRYKGGVNREFVKYNDELEISFYDGNLTAKKLFDDNYNYFTAAGENKWSYHYNLR